MADDDKSEEAAPVETNALQPTERNFEAEAREMGWTPEAEWMGKKPVKFLSAAEFVERGETLIPILNKRLTQQKADFAKELDGIKRVNASTVASLEKQHAKDLAEAKAAKTVAVKAGNVEEVERLDGVIDDLKEDAPKKLSGAALEKHNLKVQEEWVGTQDWWGEDEDMQAWAIGKSQSIAAKNPDISIEDNIAQLEVALKKKYPEKFGLKASTNGHALVDNGGDFPGGRGTDPLSRLPNEARAQAKLDMAKYPKIYPNAAAWIATYEGKT